MLDRSVQVRHAKGMSRKAAFQFKAPAPVAGVSDIVQTILQLAPLAITLAREDRTAVAYKYGKPENVAEHSNMLSIIAPALAEQSFPNLDANLIARFASIHDIVEAYVGDTPTHEITPAGTLAKTAREAAGLTQLKKEYAHLPSFISIVEAYEDQKVPEARFVRVLDKLMPLTVHFYEIKGKEGETTLRTYATKEKLLRNSAEKADELRQQYPELGTLIDARVDLSNLAARTLLP